MNKIVILWLFIVVSANSQFLQQSNLILSANISGDHKLSAGGNSITTDVGSTGFSGTLEGDFYKADKISFGIGSELMLYRELEDDLGKIKFESSFFGTLKVLMSSSEDLKLYGKARLGYAIPKGDDDYEGGELVSYGGGSSKGFGIEYYFTNNNFLELLFVDYSGRASIFGVDLNIKHSHVNIGFGISMW